MAIGFPVKDDYVTGDVLTAANMNDLSGTLNTIQSVEYAAGKNAIINGAFNVWQRGTTFTNTTVNTYTADRWFFGGSGNNTGAISRQTFTPGTAPVAGYEGQFFFRFDQTTTAISPTVTQRIEDVRKFAGQTVTVSFWAKTASSMNGLRSITINQNFGSGGSGTVTTTVNSAVATTTAWTRFSYSVAVPSISGKTVGTSSYFELSFNTAEFVAVTLDIWGVQVEASSTASDFQTATGTIQGELAACQRYYWRFGAHSGGTAGAYQQYGITGYVSLTTQALVQMMYPVRMRATPTSIDFANISINDQNNTTFAISALTFNAQNDSTGGFVATIAGATANRFCIIQNNNNTGGFLGISAEL
jgi:hypothetical protein